MIVTIDTLNGFGLQIEDNSNNAAILANIVSNHEREYFDACLSIGLSDVFTEETKNDERFLALRNSAVVDDYRTKGLDYGVNHYIYFYFLLEPYRNTSQSGTTIQIPENSVLLDQNVALNDVYNKAIQAQNECIYQITQSEDYSEVTTFIPLSGRNSYNF